MYFGSDTQLDVYGVVFILILLVFLIKKINSNPCGEGNYIFDIQPYKDIYILYIIYIYIDILSLVWFFYFCSCITSQSVQEVQEVI